MKLAYYPLLFNINRKRFLFIGGGEVARRKIRSLLLMEPHILVIAPRIDQELQTLAADGMIEVLEREACVGDLEACDYAFLCTDNRECNADFAMHAKERRIPVNVADDPELCDFHLPAVHVDEETSVVISVSTQGKNPSLARRLRDQIRELLHTGVLCIK